ncbi:MAG TPA: histidinol-phosphatase HisJ family protein [Candidatus Limnocylindrales bacterium]
MSITPRQAVDFPIDTHLHTAFSHDSNVLLELYAAQAAQLGVREIAITDHVDFMPGSPGYRYFDYDVRRKVIHETAERWAGKVAIRHGVELTYETRYQDEIAEYLRTHSFDYSIGSVHAVSDSPYARAHIATFVSGKTVAEAVAPYFAEVEAAARSGMFDTIGHLDQCKRWLRPWFSPADFAMIPASYEPLLVALVESGTALEVNSSGLRYPEKETYPGAWVVARFHELGGERVTVGSDAHMPESFAFGLEEAAEIVAAAGFDRLSLERAFDRGDLKLPDRFLRPG